MQKIRAISVPDYHAQRQVLRFPPPLLGHAVDPAKFNFAWRLLQFCFDFPDPRGAVTATAALDQQDGVVIGRFITKAKSLAGSPFLAHPTSVEINVRRKADGLQIEQISADFPHEESERGFMTLLCQFAHEGEPASFKRAAAIAMQHDTVQGEPNADLLRR